jgi:glutaredoxin
MLKSMHLFVIGIAGLIMTSGLRGQPPVASNLPEVNRVRFEAFVRGDLPAAQEVEAYTEDLKKRVPGLEIVVHDVLEDRQQLVRLHKLTKEFGREKAVVPSFYCCNRMYFGFADAESSGPRLEDLFTADVYTRNTCSRCQAAKAFIRKLQPNWPAIRFRIHEVTYDANARAKWEELCRSAGQLPGLPTIDFGGRILIGYQGDSTSGKQLEQLIEQVSGAQEAPKPSPQPPPDPTRIGGRAAT